MEHELKLIELKLEHGTSYENNFSCIEDELPCTLHIENRLGFTSMSLIFLECHRNCDNGTLFDALGRGLTGHWKECVSSVTALINKEILGTEENPSQ